MTIPWTNRQSTNNLVDVLYNLDMMAAMLLDDTQKGYTSHDILIISIVLYIPRNMHTVFALLCFVVVIHWLISPYPWGLLHWHCGNLTIAQVPAKQPWWIWINTSCEFIMNDCITTTKQSTTKPCAYFLGYNVCCFLRGLQNSRSYNNVLARLSGLKLT